jgi:membrane-associated protein
MEIIAVVTHFICDHAQHAHWLIFGSLILAGFNLPISEDLMLITSGMLASTVVPENTVKLFLGVFLGCYLSDWIAYWIGRLLGKKLWNISWFSGKKQRCYFDNITHFYKKYGVWALFIGRFIPFGVRNCLFLFGGMTKMHFGKFLLSDGIACFISNTALFSLAYYFGKNYEFLWQTIKTFNIIIFSVFACSVLLAIILRKNITIFAKQGGKA